MADKVTTTSKKKADADPLDRVDAAKAELREALIAAGQEEGTVDALMYALRLPEDAVVGNLADLQRLGALVAKGEASGGTAVEEAVVTKDVDADNPTAPAKEA